MNSKQVEYIIVNNCSPEVKGILLSSNCSSLRDWSLISLLHSTLLGSVLFKDLSLEVDKGVAQVFIFVENYFDICNGLGEIIGIIPKVLVDWGMGT